MIDVFVFTTVMGGTGVFRVPRGRGLNGRGWFDRPWNEGVSVYGRYNCGIPVPYWWNEELHEQSRSFLSSFQSERQEEVPAPPWTWRHGGKHPDNRTTLKVLSFSSFYPEHSPPPPWLWRPRCDRIPTTEESTTAAAEWRTSSRTSATLSRWKVVRSDGAGVGGWCCLQQMVDMTCREKAELFISVFRSLK